MHYVRQQYIKNSYRWLNVGINQFSRHLFKTYINTCLLSHAIENLAVICLACVIKNILFPRTKNVVNFFVSPRVSYY